ncbi:MAG: HlyD family efflux transporter periplasmic adaptor subunit, partial [Myxococcota bacterium]
TIEAADARIRQAKNKVQGAQLKLKAARGELTTAELNITRQRELAQKGLISQRKLELTELKQIKAEADVRNLQAELEAAKGEVLAKRAERASKAADMDAKIASVSNKLEEARSKLAKAQATLAKAETNVARQSTMQVFAPRSGTIMRVLARQGVEFVKEGDTLAILVPETDQRAVELWVSGNDIPLVTTERHVRLQFEGWPAVQFGGWPGAQAGTFAGNVSFIDARAEDTGLFRVVVVPDPESEPWPPLAVLRQGARANGWILLNQVTIGFEIWRQVNGFPPTLPEDAAKQLGKQQSKPSTVSKNKVGKISNSLGGSDRYIPSTSTSSGAGK